MEAKIILLEIAKWVSVVIVLSVAIGVFVFAYNTNWIFAIVSIPVALGIAFIGLATTLSFYYELGE